MTENTKRHPWRAALAVAAVSAVAVVGLGAPAALAASVIDQTEGSLTIHKHETPTGAPGDGTELTPGPTSDTIDGVEFTVRQVAGVDLSTNAGWLTAQQMYDAFDPADATAGLTFESPDYVETTANGGIADFTALPIGLYLVEETNTPAGVVASAPFLVTIPITNPDNDNEWIYDVHVYPKNSVIGVTKAVEDTDDYAEGDKVEWIVTAEIPDLTGTTAQDITSYTIVDDLDSRLAVTADPADTAVLVIDPAVALVRDTDYQVIIGDNPATTTVTEDANTVSVVFLEPGLNKLEGSRASKVQLTIATTVLETGVIPNDATLFTSNPFSKSEVDSNVVNTCWGALNVLKVDAADNATVLDGATFELYSSTATNPAVADLEPVLSGGSIVSITTANGGLASIDLLRCSDFEDNATLSPVRTYYLKETVAPNGYELLAQPIPFTITKSDVEAYTPTSIGLDLTVKDVKKFVLPLTGGSGTAFIYLTGIALLVGGAVFLVIRRRAAKHHS